MDSINGFSFTSGRDYLEIHTRGMNKSLQRLATGHRINAGKDDPAGMIVSQNLRATLAALEAESKTLERTDQVASVADGVLNEVSSLLIDAESLSIANASTGGLSDDEIAANQMEIDSIISSVRRLTSNANFNGESLFDGSMTLSAGDATQKIDSVSPESLGAVDVDGVSYTLADVSSGGALDSSTSSSSASNARLSIRQALEDVSQMRGRIGSFQRHTVQTRLSVVGTQMENVAAAHSAIADTDYAMEVAEFNRERTLGQASLLGMKQSSELSKLVLKLLE